MLQLERLSASFDRCGRSRADGYKRIKAGLFPEQIRPGTKPALVPAFEVDEVIKAEVAGVTDAQLKALVAELKAKRAELVKPTR